MSENTLTLRRIGVGIATVAGVVGLVAAMPASATDVEPEEFPGNQTCADLAPEGVTWSELKYEPVESGSDTEGALTVDVTVHDNEDTGPTFDWESNIGVDAVFVKGGNVGGNLYSYDESEGDSGLHAPENPSGKWAGLSHISFCYDEDDTTDTTLPGIDTTLPGIDTTLPGTATTEPTDTTTPAGPKAPVAPAAQPVTGQPTYTG